MKSKKLFVLPGVFFILWSCGDANDGQSTFKSNTDYGECSQILSQGIYDEMTSAGKDSFKQEVANWFCSMDESTFADKYLNSDSNASTSGKTSGTSLGGNFEDLTSSVGLDFGQSSSKTSGTTSSKEEIKDTFKSWKSSHCGTSNSMTDQEMVYSISKRNPNSAVVAAWQQCVTKQTEQGLTCWAISNPNIPDQAIVKVKYSSGQTLPRKMAINVTHDGSRLILKNPAPSEIKVGDGISLQYSIINQNLGAIVTVNGNTTNPDFSSSCNVSLPGKKPEIKLDQTWKFVTGIDQVEIELPIGIHFERSIDPKSGDEFYAQTVDSKRLKGLNEYGEQISLKFNIFTDKCEILNSGKNLFADRTLSGKSFWYFTLSDDESSEVRFVYKVKQHCLFIVAYESNEYWNFDYIQKSDLTEKLHQIAINVRY